MRMISDIHSDMPEEYGTLESTVILVKLLEHSFLIQQTLEIFILSLHKNCVISWNKCKKLASRLELLTTKDCKAIY